MKPEPTTVTVCLSGGKTISFESGKLAKQAHGSVVVRLGENVVLATATANADPREGIDFFPLTVDYREYTYAGGRFPGGFIKREGRMSEREVLTSRQIDRPIRPMFAERASAFRPWSGSRARWSSCHPRRETVKGRSCRCELLADFVGVFEDVLRREHVLIFGTRQRRPAVVGGWNL